MTQEFNKEQLRRAAEYLKHTSRPEDDTLLTKKQRYISLILNSISNSDDCWLLYCPFSYEFAKEKIEDELNQLIRGQYNDEINIDLLLLDCMCFVRETILSVQREYPGNLKNGLLYGTRDLDEIWTWFIELDKVDINER